jgi:hypothetical protein
MFERPNALTVWELGNPNRQRPEIPLKEMGQPTRAALSADGKRLLTIGSNGNVILWDADTGQRIPDEKLFAQAALSVAFSADGRQGVAFTAAKARVWPLPD